MKSKQKIYNLYKDEKISIIKTVVSVSNEEDLNTFWDFFINFQTLHEDEVISCTKIVYDFLTKILKKDKSIFVNIVLEESKKNFYISFLNEKISKEIKAKKKKIDIAFKSDNKRVTFLLEKRELKKAEEPKSVVVHEEKTDHLKIEPLLKEQHNFLTVEKIEFEQEVKPSLKEEPKPNFDIDEFVVEQLEQFINEDLEELTDTHNYIDSSIIEILQTKYKEDISGDVLYKLKDSFSKYASMISYYPFFNDLGKALAAFSVVMKDNELPEDEELVKNIFTILESFMYVLGKWQDDLKAKDLRSVTRLDASLISDIQTISNLWLGQYDEEEGDMEFF